VRTGVEDVVNGVVVVEAHDLITIQRCSASQLSTVSRHVTWQGQCVKNFKQFKKVKRSCF